MIPFASSATGGAIGCPSTNEALRQSLERFKLFMQVMNEGIADWNISSDEYVYSDRYCSLLGYDPGTLEQGHAAWLARVHPDDQADVLHKLREHLEQQIPFDVECRVRTKSDAYRWFRFRGQAAFVAGHAATRMVKTMSDISQHKEMELEISHARDQLRRLALRLLETQETERKNIARELHDEVGQTLAGIKLSLQSIQRGVGNTAIAIRLINSIRMVDELSGQVRKLSSLLRPPQLDVLGLSSALAWHIEKRLHTAGLTVNLVFDPLLARLRLDLETNCFRIVQEALTNILRHAKATRVSVELRRYAETLEVRIVDNGIGFDMAKVRERTERGECIGLFGIEERAKMLGGHVTVRTAIDEGTDIRVSFPILLAGPRSRAKQR